MAQTPHTSSPVSDPKKKKIPSFLRACTSFLLVASVLPPWYYRMVWKDHPLPVKRYRYSMYGIQLPKHISKTNASYILYRNGI